MADTAILLTTYNGSRWLPAQLDSLLSQTDRDFVIWIHDDGSSDDTMKIVEKYCKDFPGMIRAADYPPAGGAKQNFFSLMRHVDADWYFFCDQDDIWLPDKVARSRKAAMRMREKYGDIPLAVFGDMYVADMEGNIIQPSYLQYMKRDPRKLSLRQLLRENKAAGCTMVINRQLAREALRFRQEENIVMHDWWLMLTAAALGRIGFINSPLLLYRQHGDNQIGAGKSTLAWAREKAGNLLEGKQYRSSMKGILEQRRMAGELAELLPENHPDKAFLKELAEIGNSPKPERMKFYREHPLLPDDNRNRWKIWIV